MVKKIFIFFILFLKIRIIFSTENINEINIFKNLKLKLNKQKLKQSESHNTLCKLKISSADKKVSKLQKVDNFFKKSKKTIKKVVNEDEPLNLSSPKSIYKHDIINKIYNSINKNKKFQKINICDKSIFYSPNQSSESDYLFSKKIKYRIVTYLQMLNTQKYIFIISIVAPELTISFLNVSADYIFENYQKNMKQLADLLQKYIENLNDIENIIIKTKKKNPKLKYVDFTIKIYKYQQKLYKILYQFFKIANKKRPLLVFFYNFFLHYHNLKNKNNKKKNKVVLAKKYIILLNLISELEYETIAKKIYLLLYNYHFTDIQVDQINIDYESLFLVCKNFRFFGKAAKQILEKNNNLFLLCFAKLDKNLMYFFGLKKETFCIWCKIFSLIVKNNELNKKLQCYLNGIKNKKKIVINNEKNSIRAEKILEIIFHKDLNVYRIFKTKNSLISKNIKISKGNSKTLNYKKISKSIKKSFNNFFRVTLEQTYPNLCYDAI